MWVFFLEKNVNITTKGQVTKIFYKFLGQIADYVKKISLSFSNRWSTKFVTWEKGSCAINFNFFWGFLCCLFNRDEMDERKIGKQRLKTFKVSQILMIERLFNGGIKSIKHSHPRESWRSSFKVFIRRSSLT